MLHRKRAIGDGRPFLWKNLILSVVLWYCGILVFHYTSRQRRFNPFADVWLEERVHSLDDFPVA